MWYKVWIIEHQERIKRIHIDLLNLIIRSHKSPWFYLTTDFVQNVGLQKSSNSRVHIENYLLGKKNLESALLFGIEVYADCTSADG